MQRLFSQRLTLIAVLLTVLALLVTACGGSTAPAAGGNTGNTANASNTAATTTGTDKETLVIALGADPPQLDPMKSGAAIDREVYQGLYDTLVTYGKDLTIKPDLADKWEISPDGKTYTFFLHKGVKFHDGTDFNADAVIFNFKRDQDKASHRRNELSAVTSVTKVDDYTVKVQLKEPFAPFLSILADRAGMMVSPTAVEKEGDNFSQQPVGTGPFMFKERVKGDHITLVANPNYWKPGEPKVKTVIYKAITDGNVAVANLRAGQVDMLVGVPPSQLQNLKADPNVTVDIVPGLGYQGIWLNVTKPPFDNKYLRQAVAAAIDRTALVKVVFGDTAQPSVSPFPPGTPAYVQEPIPAANVAKAKELLAQGGKPNGFTFTLSVPPGPVSAQLAQVIQSMESQAGITVKIEQVEFGTLLGRLDKFDYQASPIGWSGRVDPDQNIYSFMVTKGGFNNSGYSNPRVDALLKQARVESDMAKRRDLYKQVVDIIDQDVPYIYTYVGEDVIAYRKGIEGFVHVPDGMVRVATIAKQ